MVKYLNNRGAKSRANREQKKQTSNTNQTGSGDQNNQNQQNAAGGVSQNQSQTGGSASAGIPSAGASQNKAGMFQDHPGTSFLQKSWKIFKKIMTYQPNEYDDEFSLGERRTENTPEALEAAMKEQQSTALDDQNQANQQQVNQDQAGVTQNNNQQQGIEANSQQQGGQQGNVQQANNQDQQSQYINPPQGSAPYFQLQQQGAGQGSQQNSQQGNQQVNQQGGQQGKGQINTYQGFQSSSTHGNQNTPQQANQNTAQQANQNTAQQANQNTAQQANQNTAQQANQNTAQQANQNTPQQANQNTPQQANQNTAQQANQNTPQQGNHNTSPQVKQTVQGGTLPGKQTVPIDKQVHFKLDKNLEYIKRAFNIPENKGFAVREFSVGFDPPTKAFLIFTEGLADKTLINKQILDPLMVFSSLKVFSPSDPVTLVMERLVSANQVEQNNNFTKIIESVLTGTTGLFIDGSNSALLIETKGWEHRAIDRPQVENVVRGPQEGFNEVLISNIALVRSRLRTEKLMSETFKVGRLSKADVAVMYLSDVVNPALLTEVRKRLNTLGQVDYIPDTGILEQFIEDNPFSLAPQTLSTERPDRVAAYLSEGHVAILMSSTPFAIVLPATFWSLLHSAEDAYVRFPFGFLLRGIRVVSMLIAMFLPAFYVAIVNFHQNMLPTDLLFSIAAAREKVPFPAALEIILMEFCFELIREAGIRIPSIIGTTIGIVGALILGQAAVQAALISPLVIIIISLTGLGSFTIPNYNLAFNIRLIRFIYIGLASIGGFFTISLGMLIQLTLLCSQKSFGVPILSPASPNRASKDTIFRSPTWIQEKRPSFLRPLNSVRQAPVSRAWDPDASKKRGGQS